MLELYCFYKCYLSLLNILKESSCQPLSMGGKLHRKNKKAKKGGGDEKLKSFFFSLFVFAYSVVKELLSGCLWTAAGLSAAVFYLILMGRQKKWPK